jgi:xylulokinase
VSPVALGIDVGTTSVKAILLDADGCVVAASGNEHGIERRAGVVEADPRRWWDSACAALRQLAAQAGGPMDDVVAAGVTGNMSSVVLLDENLEPLGNAPLLADSRGERELAALPAEVRDLIFARTRNRPASAFSLSTLLYLRDEAPGLLEATRTWMTAKDFLRLGLTGSVGTDLTDAYNSLLIGAEGTSWDPELIAAADLPARIFPVVSPSAQPVGSVHAEAAARTGIPPGVAVVAGAGDVAAAALGAGVTDPGDVLISLGTSVTVIAPVDQGSGTAWLGSLTYHPSASGRPGLALGSLLTGGLALNWLRDMLGTGPTSADTGRPLEADDPLVFLPHLAGTGSPRFQPHVQGSVVGVRPSTRPTDLVQAMFEAIAFEIAEALALLGGGQDGGQDGGQKGEILICGGGARLPAWVQTIADVLGRPVTACAEPDVSAIGVASLAWQGLTGRPQPLTAGAKARYEPITERAGPLGQRAASYYRTRDFMATYYEPRTGQETQHHDPDRHR